MQQQLVGPYPYYGLAHQDASLCVRGEPLVVMLVLLVLQCWCSAARYGVVRCWQGQVFFSP